MKYYINTIGTNKQFKTIESVYYKTFNKQEIFTNKADSTRFYNQTKLNNKLINFDMNNFYYVITILFNENNEIIKSCCYDLLNKKYIKDFNINDIVEY